MYSYKVIGNGCGYDVGLLIVVSICFSFLLSWFCRGKGYQMSVCHIKRVSYFRGFFRPHFLQFFFASSLDCEFNQY